MQEDRCKERVEAPFKVLAKQPSGNGARRRMATSVRLIFYFQDSECKNDSLCVTFIQLFILEELEIPVPVELRLMDFSDRPG